MFLDYLALALLSLTAVFYLFIYIHDLPQKIAKQREPPRGGDPRRVLAESLTLHALWPIVFTWSMHSGESP